MFPALIYYSVMSFCFSARAIRKRVLRPDLPGVLKPDWPQILSPDCPGLKRRRKWRVCDLDGVSAGACGRPGGQSSDGEGQAAINRASAEGVEGWFMVGRLAKGELARKAAPPQENLKNSHHCYKP